jgi:hypothetical protein
MASSYSSFPGGVCGARWPASENSRRAIIVSMPGTLQESLRANLEPMPGVEVVALAGGGKLIG